MIDAVTAGREWGGIRDPIAHFMEYEAELPPRYMEAIA
jgi:hypothetical protein